MRTMFKKMVRWFASWVFVPERRFMPYITAKDVIPISSNVADMGAWNTYRLSRTTEMMQVASGPDTVVDLQYPRHQKAA